MIMTPGLGYYYSGMARSKNALTLIMLCFMSFAVVTIQWFIFGFSLTFSDSGGKFWGDCTYCLFRNVGQQVLANVITVPTITFQFYQLMFATITPALIFGSTAERVRLLPAGIFVFLWSTFVYSPIAYWAWSANGWLNVLGYLDFAGGTPVHTSSGFAGLAFAIVIGRRKHTDDFKASSIANVFLGTALLWFGWFGFNGGSEIASNARAANAMVVTNIAASVGGLVWMLLDYLSHKKVSGLGFCSGAVAGLVGITPASGFVSPASAIAIGGIVSVVCNTVVKLKGHFFYDDTLDSFNVHGIGGFTGDILTGIFAQKWVKAMNIYPNAGSVDSACIDSLPGLGWLDGNWVQVPKQLAGAGAGAAWAFVLTYIIVFVMQKIPGLQLRVSHETEVLGSDQAEMGEVSYDYVESLSQVSREDIKMAAPAPAPAAVEK
ncbi:ammonium transporter 1 [Gonapodya prolifera JEL478]|uniref:Ammonium transporter n=1 Tax=Gonapodya prolifera (strain JEL478) TaxID=1344416 RepID=A0A139ALT4_GONPJ|nr:ammonium transporter 1 [Gonapodya prolifera JEL478]|eukprot:KXS17731.1 ammonium transporter 1 [Gonapodya prolifera JEL478]